MLEAKVLYEYDEDTGEPWYYIRHRCPKVGTVFGMPVGTSHDEIHSRTGIFNDKGKVR